MNILSKPRCVIIESPYAATAERTKEQHRAYLLAAMRYCVERNESPVASHHWLPDILDDNGPYERQLGIRCGVVWGERADLIAVFSDLGVSTGMKQAIEVYKSLGKPIEWRSLDTRVVRKILGMDIAA